MNTRRGLTLVLSGIVLPLLCFAQVPDNRFRFLGECLNLGEIWSAGDWAAWNSNVICNELQVSDFVNP